MARLVGYGLAAPVVAVVWLLTSLACGDGGADYLLFERFFAASRLRDRTALARFSTVVFEPHVDGIVVRFEILGSGAAQPEPSLDPMTQDAVRDQVLRLSLDEPVAAGLPATTSAAVVVSREITIGAIVRARDGTATRRTLRARVQRAQTTGPSARIGRWVVTSIR